MLLLALLIVQINNSKVVFMEKHQNKEIGKQEIQV